MNATTTAVANLSRDKLAIAAAPDVQCPVFHRDQAVPVPPRKAHSNDQAGNPEGVSA